MEKKILLGALLVLMLFTPVLVSRGDQVTVRNLITDPGILINGFDSVGEWTVGGTGASQVSDTANHVEGTASLKLTATAGPAYTTKTISLDLSSATVYSIWVYVYDYASLNTITVCFSSSASLSKWFELQIWNYGLVPGWNHLVLDPNVFTNINGENWANTMVRLRVGITPTGGATSSVGFDDLRYNLQAKAKCIITFDDGRDCVYLLAKPILDSNNQRGVSFVIASNVGGSVYMTLGQLNDLYSDGWDISDHTRDHLDLNYLDAEALDAQINGGYNWLVANGFTRSAKFFAYPYGSGHLNPAVLNKVGENHIFARDGVLGTYQALLTPSVPDPNYDLKSFCVYDTTPIAAVKAAVDQTINQKGLLIFTFHKLVESEADLDAYSNLASYFQEISDYLVSKSAGIDVVTFSDLVTFNPQLLDLYMPFSDASVP